MIGVDVLAVLRMFRKRAKGVKERHNAEQAIAAVAELVAERDRLRARLDTNTCNRGHVTLPLTLWDCPECHAQTKRKLADLVEKGRFAQEAMMLRDWHVRVDNEGEARGRRKAHDDLAAAVARAGDES